MIFSVMPNELRARHKRAAAPVQAAWPRPSRPAAAAHRAASSGHDVKIVRHIHHRWVDLFNLVLDVERYPAFVPHCSEIKLYSRKVVDASRTIIVSRMSVGLSALEVSYANRTVGDLAARRIDVEAIDGPLRHLHVVWTFEPDGDDWSRVGVCVDYAFGSTILAALASRAFEAMFGEIVDAFERRADRLFGRNEARC
jgi:coenzyme Q-binding protein COQ10